MIVSCNHCMHKILTCDKRNTHKMICNAIERTNEKTHETMGII
jgi:hypothetical protein